MELIDHKDLRHPEINLKIEEGVQILDTSPECCACSKTLDFTETAIEEISFVRMCEVTQTIFDCPHCGISLIIFPKGGIETEMRQEDLVVGPPSDGFFITRLP